METIWKDIKGFEGLYKISNHGDVLLLKRSWVTGRHALIVREERLAKKSIKKQTGYYAVSLSKDCKQKQYEVHRLVAEHFIPNPENKKTVNHIDSNRLNNSVDNLEWATYSENTLHAYRNNRINQWGGRNPGAVGVEIFVNNVRLGYWPAICEAAKATGINRDKIYRASVLSKSKSKDKKRVFITA
jgi:hypothetical protein